MVGKYRRYFNQDGNFTISARRWHPAWFIPIWCDAIYHWLFVSRRYYSYQYALRDIYNIMSDDDLDIDSKLDNIWTILYNINCDYGCDWVEPYGFVPEAGCSIHDNGG